MGGPSVALGGLVSLVLLILEMSGLSVPLVNLCRDGVEGYDVFHEWHGNSSGKEADKDIVVSDANMGNITLKG